MKTLDALKKMVGEGPDMEGMERAFNDTMYKAHLKIWLDKFYDCIEALETNTRAYVVCAYLLKKINIFKGNSSHPNSAYMDFRDYGWITMDSDTTDGNNLKAHRIADKEEQSFNNLEDALDYVFAKA